MINQLIVNQLSTNLNSSLSEKKDSINSENDVLSFSDMLSPSNKTLSSKYSRNLDTIAKKNSSIDEDVNLKLLGIEFLANFLNSVLSEHISFSQHNLIGKDLLLFSSKQLNNLENINDSALVNNFINIFSVLQKKFRTDFDNQLSTFIQQQSINNSAQANIMSEVILNDNIKDMLKLNLSKSLDATKNYFNICSSESQQPTKILDSNNGSNDKLSNLIDMLMAATDTIDDTQVDANKKSLVFTRDLIFQQPNLRNNQQLTIHSKELDLVNHVNEQIDWEIVLNRQSSQSLIKSDTAGIIESNLGDDLNTFQMTQPDKSAVLSTGKMNQVLQFQMREPTFSSGWAEEIRKNIISTVATGITKAEIKLNPQELGSINIQLQLNEKNIAILHVVTPNNMIRSLFESSIDALKNALSGEGILLDDSFVSTQDFENNRQNNSSSNFRKALSINDEEDNLLDQPQDNTLDNRLNSSGVDAFV